MLFHKGPEYLCSVYRWARTSSQVHIRVFPASMSGGDFVPSWQRPTKPESRWAAFGAALIIIAGQTWVAASLSLRPVWLYPTIAGSSCWLRCGLHTSRTEPSRALRVLSLSVIAVLVIANMLSVVLLVRGSSWDRSLASGPFARRGRALDRQRCRLRLIYWELDGAGPRLAPTDIELPTWYSSATTRPAGTRPARLETDLPGLPVRVAHQRDRVLAHDAMPYSKLAKLVMGIESMLSFVIAAMLVARAINIARG